MKMSMNDLKDAFKLIEQRKENYDFEPLDSEEIINIAEDLLKTTFPPTYRLFLKNYGCGGVGSLEIYGIVRNNLDAVGVPNVVWVILKHRKQWELPESHIIISDTGDGYWYILDSSQANADGEYPVFIYGFGEDGKSQEKVNEDFGEFLLEKITQRLAWDDEEDDSSAGG